MNDLITKCGKYTIIFEKEKKYYAKVKRCNQWNCPFCGEKKKAQLLDSISYYQEIFGMNNMLTLTTCSTSKKLDKQFKKLLDCISLFSFSRYKSKNGGTIEQFNKYIEKLTNEESYLIWLLESKVHSKGKEYIPRVHYAILFFEHMKNRTLHTFFTSIGIKGKHFEKYYSLFEKKYSSYKRYIDLKNRNEKLGYLYYQDFNELFRFVFLSLTPSEIDTYKSLAMARIEYNVNRDENTSKEIAYIRIVERTKKGRIHYHILTNFYVPYSIMQKVSTIETFSSDQTSFDSIVENENNYESDIGKYLVKYVTKDIGEDENDNQEQECSNQRIITCSQNIKLNLSEHTNQGYKYYDEYIGTCEKEFMPIEEDLYSFRIRIMNNSIEQSKYYNERKALVDMVSIEKKKLEEKYKEEYLSSHDFFDSKDYKKSRNEYLKKNMKAIEEFSKKKVSLFDNLYLVKSEIVRHKDSPPIDENSIYYDDTLDSWQNQFIHKALVTKGNIALLGGAGSGKSHCISSLVKAIPKDKEVLVCAYTGKATSRLYELIGTPPQNVVIETIHKSCNALWGTYTTFRNNENNMLSYDVCIVDEISMVDTFLFFSLLNALKPTCKIIVVGDFNQLEPCENNSLESFVDGKDFYVLKPLRRIFDSEFDNDYYFTRIHLTKNYRSDDKINQLAYKFLGKYEKDIFQEYRLDIALYLIATQGYKVLCNTNDVCRTINRRLTINFPIKGCNGYNYRINQEIMFLKNDMQRNFYNGMLGTITNYDETTRIITINNTIQIQYWETKTLIQPTFALTIHKSQGSEMDKVIIILRNNNNLLNYKITYTSVTRARKDIILMKENGIDEKKLYKIS